MQSSIIEAINKLNISSGAEGAFGDERDIRILWLSAFCFDNKDTLNFRPHNHTFFELHFTCCGSMRYRFDDVETEIGEGNFVLIPPHSIHCIVDHSSDFQKISISFEVKKDTDVYDSLCQLVKRTCKSDEDVNDSIAFILRQIAQKTAYQNDVIRNRLVEIIYLIASTSTHRPSSSSSAYDPRLLKAKKFIEDNPHIFLTCDEVAQFCRLSSKQLGRLFQHFENCSLLDFIHGQKIEAAKKMIRETDEIFEAISEKLGFSSVNYFGKFFYRCTGMTPGEYRKSYVSQ